MRCETDVPLNERGERVEVGDADDDADPDLDDAASEPGSASSDGDCEEEGCDDPEQVEDVETVTCKGVIKPLAEADEVLEDDEWVAEAIHSAELRRRYQDFKAQAQLDNPPPMVSAFC
jgi:hypothetical protein